MVSEARNAPNPISLAGDYQPISDMRASAAYRGEVAAALLRKALIEISGSAATRVTGQRREVA